MQCEVMVTAGANQAFTNVVLTLLDTNDSVVLFKPYYFNHLMAVQMTGGGANTVFGRYMFKSCSGAWYHYKAAKPPAIQHDAASELVWILNMSSCAAPGSAVYCSSEPCSVVLFTSMQQYACTLWHGFGACLYCCYSSMLFCLCWQLISPCIRAMSHVQHALA